MTSDIPKIDEKQLQVNTIELLKSMGYIFISQKENVTYRSAKLSEVILKDILLKQLQKLNSFEYKGITYPFSSKNISRAVDDLDAPLNEGLMVANSKISDLLLLGKTYQEELQGGIKKSFSLKYIDFKNPHNNLFHVTEEFSVSRVTQNEHKKYRRPDLVLFINGIPFGVIELKSAIIDVSQGIYQMIRNQRKEEISQLFKFVQITLSGNNHSPLYATTGTPKKFYSFWKEDVSTKLSKIISQRTPSKLDSSIYSLFEKERVCELLQSYIVFDNRVKKIARYQQYFAIKEIMKKTDKLDRTGRRAGGLIWHTQGSGKSLTMVMLTRVIKKEIFDAKIVVVTDRKDLDKQIHRTFKHGDLEAEKANNGKHLLKLLRDGKSIITTLINKFETVVKEKKMPNEPNIFILVDESHRTQSGNLNRAMNKVFPHSCYLGFTGTPLFKKDKSSIAKFGGLIHKYPINQAVKDGAVLPLLYEGRLVDQWINDEKGLDRRFEVLARNLNDEQKLDLKKKWARFQRIASSERRLEMIMDDINRHYTSTFQGTGFKAMLATNSKYEAIKYHKLFSELGEIKTAFVISAPDSKEGVENIDDDNKSFINEEWTKIIKHYGDEESYLDKVKDEFVEGDEIELLIVVSKLLTGFDAPKASVLYIDKELKEHNLLQAIARVNRLYDGKDFGFIIDYRGLLGNLDTALSSYSSLDGFDEEDLIATVIDIKEEIAKVRTFYSHLEELFKDVKNRQDAESYELFLEDEKIRKIFYEYLLNYARALKLALSSDKIDEIFSEIEVENYKQKMKFYSKLRVSIKIRYHEIVDFGKYEKQMQKLLDTFISADEPNALTKLVNIFDEDFDAEIERLVGDNARADAILSASSATITERKESNPAYYEKLSLRIKEILEQYRDGRLSDEQKLKNAQDIRNILLNEPLVKTCPKEIQNNRCACSIYDNMIDEFDILLRDNSKDLLERISSEFSAIFNEVAKKPDWVNNSVVTNETSSDIQDILWAVEDEYNIKFENIDDIVGRIRSIGINNYA